MEFKSVPLTLLGLEVLALMMAALGPVKGIIFSSNQNKMLPLPAVNRSQTAARPCDCRMECHTDPHCTAFSSYALESRPELVLCSYSYSYLLVDDLDDGEAEKKAWTFIKTRRCPDSYVYVAGTGCVVLHEYMNYTLAESACSSGSQLASPPTDAAYYHLIRYLNEAVMPVLNGTKLSVYLGLKRINGVWTWLDGHVIPSEPGTSLWLASDPNEDTDCAIMLFNLRAGYNGSLADITCSSDARVLCAIV